MKKITKYSDVGIRVDSYIYSMIQLGVQYDKYSDEQLFSWYKSGDSKAFEMIIMKNLRYVWMVAKNYNFKHLSIDINDIFYEGIKGLINSIPGYDYTKGVKFISYSTVAIQGFIFDYIKKMSKLKYEDKDVTNVAELEYTTDKDIKIIFKILIESIQNERNREILRLKYTDELTDSEIGEIFNISGERVRQLNDRSIKQLKEKFEKIKTHLEW